MNIEQENGNSITEPAEGNPAMQASPSRSSSESSRSGFRSRSSSSRSSAHSGKNASGAAVDKEAQRRGGQHSHGGR